MKEVFLRYIYRRFAAKFEDYLVEEYTKGIPMEVKTAMVDLFESQKDKFKRAVDFMAFQLHRRMATDPKNSERYQGMFIQLKVIEAIVRSRPDRKPETPAQVTRKEAPFDYGNAIDTAIKRGKESNAQG